MGNPALQHRHWEQPCAHPFRMSTQNSVVHEDQKLRATVSPDPERHHRCSTPARSNSFAQEGLHIGHRKHPPLQGYLCWKQGNHTPECQSQCCHQLHKPVRAAMAWRFPVLPFGVPEEYLQQVTRRLGIAQMTALNKGLVTAALT